jgi:hypothetical protein
MNTDARAGQWYTRLDTRQTFLVTGYDDNSRTIETQALNGDLDEMDVESWSRLPLAFAEPPEDWTESTSDADAPAAISSNDSNDPIEALMSR